MNGLVKINDIPVEVKEYSGQRVITFKEIDQVHGRAEGTARKRFGENRKHFIEDVDFFMLRRGDNALSVFRTVEIPPMGITLLTQTGYLMLVKSFTDDLAWKVQRDLVRNYFVRQSEVKKPLSTPVYGFTSEYAKQISKYVNTLDFLNMEYDLYHDTSFGQSLAGTISLLSLEIYQKTRDIKHAAEATA